MRVLLSKIFLLVFLVTCHLSLVTSTYAQSDDELDKQLKEKYQQIKELEGKLADAQAQEKTLKSQLKIIDDRTTLTLLKIEKTKFEITKLQKEIAELGNRIERISGTLDQLSEVLLNRIVSTYKYSQASVFDMLFSAHGFADAVERIRYIQAVQAYDKKQLYQLQATKTLYNDQKTDKLTRQQEQDKLQKELEVFQKDLELQKVQKEELLRVTQNDEKKFQAEIARLRADTESIARALANKGVKLGPVSKGERIASVGNTGCSTGPHLHLEVMKPAHVEDGLIIGRENKVDPLPFIQSGQFSKPTANYSGSDCSQGGSCHQGDITTRFGQVYFLGTHTGLDIADYYGASIYAVESGTAYATQDSKSCYLTGTAGKGVFVDHGNDTVTLYWHIP